MGKAKKRDINLLDLVPERTAEYEIDEARIITVLMPRFRNRLMKRLFEPRNKSPYIKIKLDDIGSEVWLLCDGKRTVGEIAELAKEKFQERLEPRYERLGRFFRQLETARFIAYVNLEERLKACGP
ncbi:MAG: PqqD family protein [Candidatus Krumholzibacteriaceae bacterium]|jgi:hypothetical protein